MVKKELIIFVFIILLAAFLRLYCLDSVPPSASLDEASIGYNAYSILTTGRDEYGTKFPILLRAYDDWRPALYVYLVIPFVKILGLNVISVRLPSAILSVLTVVATYFLVKKIFAERLPRFARNDVALLATFLLAVSPWHIYISRLGHEVNAGLAFFIFGLLASFKKRVYLAAILFSLSFASYQSEKFFLPVLLFAGAAIYHKEILQNWKKVLLACLLGLIILAPFLYQTFQPNALIRFKGTSIFEATKPQLAGKTGIIRKIEQGRILINNYLVHFNPQWLFTNSGGEAHKIPNLGLFYWWEWPFLIIGFIWLMRYIRQKENRFLFLWLLAAPLPAALTTEAPHAMRTIQIIPVPQFLSAIGLILFYQLLNSKFKIQNVFKILFYFLILISFLQSLFSVYENYFFVFPKEQSRSFQYPTEKVVVYVNSNQKKYQKIIFSNRDDLYQSYMFYLFYSKYDPFLYHNQGGTYSGGFEETHHFGKFEFRPIIWNKEIRNGEILYVGTSKELPNQKDAINFNYLNGQVGIRILTL